ncbi:MAG: Panacea domain-containing protein [Bacillota bacterium]
MRPTIQDVANFFLYRFQFDEGSSITHLKLQKLCYYAQAWNLAFEKEPLMDADFQAWIHGPVNSGLYNQYRDHQWQSIDPVPQFDKKKFTGDQLDLLEEVWKTYGKYDGRYLEELTHQEEPWQEAREGYSPSQRCEVVISNETMERFYSDFLRG